MDEKIEKAFATANYMATLSNQRRIIIEEFNQKLIYYKNGAIFKISPTLITFVKTVLDIGQTEDVIFIDENEYPAVINNVQEFFDEITLIYFEAINEYATRFTELKSKRSVKAIVDL
jgi:uncharacterized protein YlzI (FlbEa/FlbD family)